MRLRRFAPVAIAAFVSAIALAGCATPSVTPMPAATAAPSSCAQDPSCTTYVAKSLIVDGKTNAWVAAHPLSSDVYSRDGDLELDLAGPINAFNVPLTQVGGLFQVDRSNVFETAEGSAGATPQSQAEGSIDRILYSSLSSVFINPWTNAITISSGSSSITFDRA